MTTAYSFQLLRTLEPTMVMDLSVDEEKFFIEEENLYNDEEKLRNELFWWQYTKFLDLLVAFEEKHLYKQFSSAFDEMYGDTFRELTQTRNEIARIEEEEMDCIFWEISYEQQEIEDSEKYFEEYENDKDYEEYYQHRYNKIHCF